MRRYRRLALSLLLILLALPGCQAAAPLPAPATRPAGQAPASAAAGQVAPLAVVVDPAGAQVAVDGRPSGSSPVTLTLPIGVHQMALTAPGFAPLTQAVTVTASQEGIYSPVMTDIAPPTVTLAADPAQVPWLGQTHLHAAARDNRGVADLQLLLNGQLLGDVDGGDLSLDFAPAAAGGLAPGNTYTLTARATDAAGNTGQAELALGIGTVPQETRGPVATARTGTATRPKATAAVTAAATTAATAPAEAPTAAPTAIARAAATATQPPATAAPARPAPAQPVPTQAPAAPTSYHVESVVIPTYPYTRYLKTVVDAALSDYPALVFDRAAYEAAKPRPVPVAYTLVVLENRYVKLSILPDLGGRIYECIFKPTGNDEFYKNPVIKPSPWGPGGPDRPAGANWWLAAGGLEWAFPVEEHGYEWGKSWGYDFYEGDDGSATVTVFTRDYQRPYVAVEITLPPDSAAFTVQPRIVNPLGAPFRFKWWDNAMLAPGPANQPGADLRFIIPGSQVTVHSSGDASLPAAGQAMTWPAYGGRDLSRLGNWKQWLGFFARPAAQAGFAAVYDTAANEGMVRVFPSDVARGVKVFGAGWTDAIDASNWTDDGSGYVELHGGLAPTFDDWSELPPGGQVMWSETWYPAAGTGGLVYANAAAAVNLSRSGAGAHLAVYAAHPVAGRLDITLPGQPAVARQVNLSPDHPFSEDFAGAGQGDVTLKLTDSAGQAIVDYRGALR